MKTKEDIRKHYLSERNALDATVQIQASQRVCERILSLQLYKNAQHIALYQAIDKEIDTHQILLNALRQQKQIYLPVIQPGETLNFVEFEKHDRLALNRFKIPEPTRQEPFPIESLDILFMPLVAFDIRGARLGRGKGYYDKALMHQKPKKIIGVAYAFQYHPEQIPCDTWDIPLDGVITEQSVIWFNLKHPHPSLPSSL